MKKLVTALCFLFFSGLVIPLSAQIYVDALATGESTGESWANAFTDLQNALGTAESGQTIHVAKGIYKPDGPDGNPTATFYIGVDLTLIGGYSTGGLDHNPGLHKTILSGDLNDDDVIGDFSTGRTDNVMTVVTIQYGKSLEIEGFTISGGHADGIGPDVESRGGGIYCSYNSTSVVRQCHFIENFADLGGGIHVDEASSFTVQDCSFENNYSNWGGALSFYSLVGLFENCLFRKNISEGNAGALGIYCQAGILGEPSLEFTNCTFEENSSIEGRGAGLYIRIEKNNANLTLKGSTFINNETKLSGGGVRLQIGTTSVISDFEGMIDDCFFEQNKAVERSGGGLDVIMESKESSLTVINSNFFGNFAGIFGGGAFIAGNDPGDGTFVVENCGFQNNTSLSLAGGLGIGNDPGAGSFNHQTIRCNFIGNTADFLGGGLVLFNESPGPAMPDSFLVEECLVEGNHSDNTGGGIGIFSTNPGMESLIRNCEIHDNNSLKGAGVGIDPAGAEFQGVADTASIRLENCLLTGNSGDNGTIFVRQTGIVELFNCTLTDNLADALSLDTGVNVKLQNNILFNEGFTEYQSMATEVILESNGGNLVNDGSLGGINSADLENQSPIFEESPDCEYYQLSFGSPGLDEGIDWNDAPDTDLCGGLRIQGAKIDIGAVERPIVDAIEEIKVEPLTIVPNPATSTLSPQWPHNWNNPAEITIFDWTGKLVRSNTLKRSQEVTVMEFPPGLYTMKLVNDKGDILIGNFVKM